MDLICHQKDLLLAKRAGLFFSQPLLDTLIVEVVLTWQLNYLLPFFDIVVANRTDLVHTLRLESSNPGQLLLSQSLRNIPHLLL